MTIIILRNYRHGNIPLRNVTHSSINYAPLWSTGAGTSLLCGWLSCEAMWQFFVQGLEGRTITINFEQLHPQVNHL